MATFISDTLNEVDAAIAGYAETVFGNFSSSVSTLLQMMGVVGLAFIALNTLVQWVPVRVTDYSRWMVRYIVITMIATSWAQFQPIYDIITNTPGDLGAALLDASGPSDLNTALDEMITGLFDFSERANDESGYFSISLTAVLVWVVGALMACVAIIVSSIAKVGLAMAVSLAPIFIPTLMFKASGNLFESWVRFTLGFALIPLVMAGVMGAIVGIGQGMIAEAADAVELSEAAGFLIVGAAAIFLMIQVPTLVNGLAGTFVATANGVGIARQGTGVAGGGVKSATQMATPRVMQAASAIGAARSSGGGAGSRVSAALQDAKQTSASMRENRERIGVRNMERGQRTSMGERAEAGRAAMLQQARENRTTRAGANGNQRAAIHNAMRSAQEHKTGGTG
ncbi:MULTISPECIES: type IV secretion system protein [Aurantimonadaceae]|uniref:Conjugal transfer protein n=2 Tax=Jiella TaxID=1775688 RepID=A0A6N9T932_9HYPH|nr:MULTISPECIES: type IV secretion system protein [Aurantimonadaceae]MAU95531.1 conjugal transfer protein [Fulvimarina sp.]NDW06735.1 conjugal transfer protein [Jiella pacifica]ORE97056.1 putative conjugal transfer protein [Aurantimonas sp. 22II-16-19i]WAP71508.1 type IV secretion system protein [Jiella pelagia]